MELSRKLLNLKIPIGFDESFFGRMNFPNGFLFFYAMVFLNLLYFPNSPPLFGNLFKKTVEIWNAKSSTLSHTFWNEIPEKG